MTVFEELPTTILLDVLEYLSPIDRYRALKNLNCRLDSIVRSSTTHINLSQIRSREDFEYYLKSILPHVIISLRSLKISNDCVFDKEMDSAYDPDAKLMFGLIKKVQAKVNLLLYKKLEEIELKNVNGSQLQIISDKLVDMPQMKRLIVSFHGTTSDALKLILTNNVIRSILIKLKLTLTDANVTLPTTTNIESFPNVKYFKVDSCRIANLSNLCSFFANINYLDISIWDFPNQQQQSYLTKKFQFPNLTCLKLKVDEIRWTFVEHFLKQCGEKLKSFTFTGNNDFNFMNPDIWETFITNHLKQLNKFNFHVTLWDSSIDSIDLTHFNRDFWRQLNVSVACHLIDGAYEDGEDTIHVYTVPFCNSFLVTGLSSDSVITPSTNAPFKQLQTLMILLDKKPLRNTKHFYENVNSIILESAVGHQSNILPFIRVSINPENICHLGFQSIRGILKTQVFIQLLEQCPNIYSLNLHSKILAEMTNHFSNEKLCLLLQKMIKQIQFNPVIEQEDFDNITVQKFAHTFTSLERLCIHMKSSQDITTKLPILFQDMKVLDMIFIKMLKSVPNGLIDQMKESSFDLKDSYIRKEKTFLFIWR